MYLSKEREAMQALKLLKQGGKCICLFSIPAEVIISGKESLGAVTLPSAGAPCGKGAGFIEEPPADFYTKIITKQCALVLVKGISLLSLGKSSGSMKIFCAPMNHLPARGLVKMPRSQQLILILYNPFRNPVHKAAPPLEFCRAIPKPPAWKNPKVWVVFYAAAQKALIPSPQELGQGLFPPNLSKLTPLEPKSDLAGTLQLNEEMERAEEVLGAVLTLLESQIWD